MSDDRLDVERILRANETLPPSPRDGIISKTGKASLTFYLFAVICAWQIGQWWGVGLIIALWIASTLDEFVLEQHRQELIEMHDKLVHKIARNSNILDDVIPKL